LLSPSSNQFDRNNAAAPAPCGAGSFHPSLREALQPWNRRSDAAKQCRMLAIPFLPGTAAPYLGDVVAVGLEGNSVDVVFILLQFC
jgi:hypothetical protein